MTLGGLVGLDIPILSIYSGVCLICSSNGMYHYLFDLALDYYVTVVASRKVFWGDRFHFSVIAGRARTMFLPINSFFAATSAPSFCDHWLPRVFWNLEVM